MTGPDRPREDPSGDQTQMLPPGMFGRAPAPDQAHEPPLLSGRSAADPPLYGRSEPSAADSEEQTRQHSPFGARSDSDQESTQYLPATDPKPASSWNNPPADPGPWSGGQPTAEPSSWNNRPAASLPPTSPPPYAPEPPPYQPQYPGAPPAVIEPRAVAVPVAGQQSRGAAGWVSVLLGLLLAVAGVFLFTRFTFVALTEERTIGNVVAAGLGIALLFGATLLNSWSGWATLIPGAVFAGLGGLMFFDPQAETWSWLIDGMSWAFDVAMLNFLGPSGLLFIIGLLLLGASISAFIARRSGRREVTPAAAERL